MNAVSISANLELTKLSAGSPDTRALMGRELLLGSVGRVLVFHGSVSRCMGAWLGKRGRLLRRNADSSNMAAGLRESLEAALHGNHAAVRR